MGQLEMYSLEDIMLLAFFIGPLSPYIAEEVEESIEDVIAYIYSANIMTKRIIKLKPKLKYSGDITDEKQKSFDFFNLSENFLEQIYKPLYKHIMWQDPALTKWEGAAKRRRLAKLKNKYNW